MKDKQAKLGIGGWVIIAAVLFGGMLVFAPMIQDKLNPTSGQVAQGTVYTGSGTPTKVITSATTQSYTYSDKLSQGTSVTGGTVYTSRAGGAFATSITSVTQGEVMDLLVTNGSGSTTGAAAGRSYHNAWIPAHKVPNDIVDPINVLMYKNASVTVSLFNTNGDKMSINAVTTNQSVASGGSYNMKLRLDGQDKTSTQDMTCIFEASDKTHMDKIVLTGFDSKFVGTSTPSSYTVGGTSAAIWIYDLAPVTGAVSPEGTVAVISKTGQSLNGDNIIIDCRTKEHFVDSVTGLHTYGIEDSSGTKQYLAQYKGTWYFGP